MRAAVSSSTTLEAELEHSDQHLLASVRAGETEAFALLYSRHVQAAKRLARVLVSDPSDVDDLVAETFAKVLATVKAGRGPDSAFRAYLLTTLRNTFYDRGRRDRRIEYTDDLTIYEKIQPGPDPDIMRLESSYAARAFARLPERWRTVLWHTEVEGETPAQVAPLLGLTPNGVAALAYRARERLRQMYLQEHIVITANPRCHWTSSHLGGYVRAGLARRDRNRVEDHLGECAECRRLHRELTEENRGLREILAPLVLGAAAPGYLSDAQRHMGVWGSGAVTAIVAGWSRLWCLLTDGTAELVGWLTGLWFALLRLPRHLIAKYGAGNVAAAAGTGVASLLGVAVFAGVLISTDRVALPPPRALPAPTPADTYPAAPIPTAPAQLTAPTFSNPPPTLGPIEPRTAAARPRPQATTPAPAPDAEPEPGGPPVVTSEPGAAPLAAGEAGTLPVLVRLPESTAVLKDLSLLVSLPRGLTLTAKEAGDGWTCRSDPPAKTGTQISCGKATPVEGGRTVARIALAVDPDTSGYQEFGVTVKSGVASLHTSLKAAVAPRGLRLGYAGSGRLDLALAGNVLLACRPRPACETSKDNNSLVMQPLLPITGEPAAPPGLAGPDTPVSAARLELPAGAKIRWAGLTVAMSSASGPKSVQLHGPKGAWAPLTLSTSSGSGARAATQGFAEVTELLREAGPGDYWLSTALLDLPGGIGQYAGWSLVAAYELDSSPESDLAVYLGPRSLREHEQLTLGLGGAGDADAALALWDGDRSLTGDSLTLGSRQFGNGNLAQGQNPSSPLGGRTPGLDVWRGRSKVPRDGNLTLDAGSDPIEVGILATITR